MENALLLLRELHQLSNGSINHECNFDAITVKLNMNCIERDDAFRFLLLRKYILNSGMGYGCSITPEGIAAAAGIASAKRKRSMIPSINFKISDYFKVADLFKELNYKQL